MLGRQDWRGRIFSEGLSPWKTHTCINYLLEDFGRVFLLVVIMMSCKGKAVTLHLLWCILFLLMLRKQEQSSSHEIPVITVELGSNMGHVFPYVKL